MNLRPYLQFNRMISGRITAWLIKTPITPNVITLAGLGFGVAAGWVMAGGTHAALLLGAALLHLAFILDNCDGELARATGRATRFGKRLDMTSDLLVDFALWTGLGFGSAIHADAAHWIWVGLIASAGSVINFFMVVYERRHGFSTSIHIRKEPDPKVRNSAFHSVLETLCHNGDVIALVWLMAAIGSPPLFLTLASVYIHALWIFRSSRYFPKQSAILIKILFAGLGVYLLAVCAQAISWPILWSHLRQAGWGFAAALLVFPVVSFFHAMGLYYLLPLETRKRLSPVRVYRLSFFGEAVNKITPFVDIGGEPIKVQMLARTGAIEALEASRAVWRSRIVFVLSEAVYLIPAVGLLAFLHPSDAFIGTGILAVIFSLIYGIILWALKKKVIGGSGRASGIRAGDLAASFIWQLIGWVAFSAEVYIILKSMGMPVSLMQAFLIQAILQAITTVSFFIPANIGAQEGGLALLLSHLGFAAEGGFALSLLKRARQFFWAGAGFAAFMIARRLASPKRA